MNSGESGIGRMGSTARLTGAFRKSATLVINSGALAAGTVTTAVLGFAYWWLAARNFPPEAIGRASALFSMMGLIGLLGEAGLGTLLIGEIPRHRERARGLVGAAGGMGFLLMFAMSMLFAVAQPHLAPHAVLIDDLNGFVLFVIGGCLTGVTMLGGQALVGNLHSVGRMIQMMLFSAFKLALIALAVAAGGSSTHAIVWSWVGGLAASWIIYDLASRGGARRLFGPPDFALLRALKRKLFDHYALDVTMQTPGIIMPYLVLVLLSPTINAAFAPLWMLVSVASVIPAVFATALFPVVVSRPAQARHDIALSLTVSLLFSAAGALVVFLWSRELLALFNPAYPPIAGSALRFLGFSLLGSSLKSYVCALARLSDGMRKASVWFAIGGALELVFAAAGAMLGGLQGLVIAWTAAVSLEGTLGLGMFCMTSRLADLGRPSPAACQKST